MALRSLVRCLYLVLGVAASKRVRIDANTGHFVDQDGRVLIFHGVNAVQKDFPWHPSRDGFDAWNSLVEADMVNLSSWGLNAVRLGVMWPGVEPEDGVYNETYLSVMREIVDDLYSHGIYTIIDFHQDSFSQQWCGEGIPRWMLPQLEPLAHSCDGGAVPAIAKLIGQCRPFSSFNISIDPKTGFPEESGCLKVTFDQYSRTPELTSAWGNFYKSEHLQEKFKSFWRKVAGSFKGSPGVLGYDLINEPLNGNFFENYHNLIPGWFDKNVLQPMYQALHSAILEADPEAIAFYEPPPFPDTYPVYTKPIGGVYHVGFSEGPSPKDVTHQSLSYHYYSCGFASKDCDRKGDLPSETCLACDIYAHNTVGTRNEDMKKLGGAAFLTEFGACSESEKCTAEIHRILKVAEPAFHSWAYWQFKFFHDITTVSGPIESFYNLDGSLQKGKVQALSRTYAPAIAGQPLATKFEPATAAYRLTYAATAATKGLASEIFFNQEMNYPDENSKTGHIISVLNGRLVDQTDKRSNYLLVKANDANSVVDVAIARSPPRTEGVLKLSGTEGLSWKVLDAEQPAQQLEFTLSSNVTLKRWLKVIDDDGAVVCTLSVADAGASMKSCSLREDLQHKFLFSYIVQIWKEGIIGTHAHLGTLPFDVIGPILRKRIAFTYDVRDEPSRQQSSEELQILV